MWYVLTPVLIVSVIALIFIIGRRIEETNITRIEKKFGHPVLANINVKVGDDTVVATYMPWQSRSSASFLNLKVTSIEDVSFTCSPSKNFSYYEKCFELFIEDSDVKLALNEIYSIGFTSVVLKEGELSAYWHNYKSETRQFDEFAGTVGKNLLILNEKVKEYFVGEKLAFDTITDKKQKTLKAWSLAPLLIFGVIAILLYLLEHWVLDQAKLLGTSILLGMISALFFRNRVQAYSRKRSVLEKNTTKYTFGFFVGAVAFFLILCCLLNIWLPQKSVETLQVQIIRYERHSTKSGSYYNAVVKDWIHQGDEIELSLPEHKLTTDLVKVTLSKGALGFYWVSDYEYVR